MEDKAEVQAIRWSDSHLELLDQRKLPDQETWLRLSTAPEVAAAIKNLVVRGAPAIGITAAYGMVLSALRHESSQDSRARIDEDLKILAASRPTAVNLFWALDRVRAIMQADGEAPLTARLLEEARRIHREDIEANRTMGRLGSELIEADSAVLTHCNTGALATGGYGTALGVIRSGFESGRIVRVFAGETRPWLQGARLTAWELLREGIPVTLVLEGAVASLLRSGQVQWVITGADRIVANGDVANKIGTYAAAIHARHHGARMMVVAPSSTVDLSVESGDRIPIEERDQQEVLSMAGHRVAAEGASAWNPVFDVTPNELIDVIVTEKGVVRPPFGPALHALIDG